MVSRKRVVVSWSGGKDSSMALYQIQQKADFEVVGLLTTVSQEYGRICHHGVREKLLDEQAAAMGIPLHKVFLPSNDSHPCTDATYENVMEQAMRRYIDNGIATVVFGDIYLDDLRAYRERNLKKMGMSAEFPLWKRDTTQLIRDWRYAGFRALVCCAESVLDESFVGVELDENLVSRLPNGTDPCGENGEFHSFVYDGPIFKMPVRVKVGTKVTREGRFYCDLVSTKCDETETAIPKVHPVKLRK